MSLQMTQQGYTCEAYFAGRFGQRTTSDIQRAYDAAPGPPAKGAVQEEGPPSAPPAPGTSSGLRSRLYQSHAYYLHRHHCDFGSMHHSRCRA